jgi:Mce-associated membrane protein
VAGDGGEPAVSATPASTPAPAPTPTPTPAPAPGSSATGRAARWSTAIVVAAVVLTAALVVVVQRLSSHNGASADSASVAAQRLSGPAAEAALAAAVAETRATLTYDYRTLPTDIAKAETGLTPSFRASYANSIKREVESAARTYHATSTATVESGGVSAASPTTATILLFVDQTVRNSRLQAPRLDRSRVKVSMVERNGRWLVNDLSPI